MTRLPNQCTHTLRPAYQNRQTRTMTRGGLATRTPPQTSTHHHRCEQLLVGWMGGTDDRCTMTWTRRENDGKWEQQGEQTMGTKATGRARPPGHHHEPAPTTTAASNCLWGGWGVLMEGDTMGQETGLMTGVAWMRRG